MRILTISSDWNVFNEDSAVARRQRLQASTVDRFDVFVPHGPRQIVHVAGNGTMRGFGPGKLFGTIRMLFAARSLVRPDIVSSQDPFLLGFLAWLMASSRGAKLHIQIHTDLFDPYYASHSLANRLRLMLARFILRRADCVRVVSERIQRSLQPLALKIPVSVLPVFIDADVIGKAAPVDKNKMFPNFKKMLLVVSRLEEEKNVAAAIEAMPEIIKAQPGTGLVIVGSGSQLSALKESVKKSDLTDKVTFVGSQNPFPYYKAADALLFTSVFEGYGMAAVEALAAGCPVVSFDVGVAREAGTIIVTPQKLASTVAATLSEGRRGKLAYYLPSETEYRDLWRAQIALTLGASGDMTFTTRGAETLKQFKVGFVGQGFIGKNYADEMERRGLSVVRYALEEPYRDNKEKIQGCDIVFIAVPTPTTPKGFDDSIVREAVSLVGRGKIAVIKSTMLPGMTADIQKAYPDRFVVHSPEFLREATAAYDAARPDRNIVGIPNDTAEARERAKDVLSVLPPAPFELVCTSKEAEIIKYAGNSWLYFKVVYANMLYDFTAKLDANYQNVREALAADPRIGRSHLDPVHASGHPGSSQGRGAGGHCLIKDFAALRMEYEKQLPEDKEGVSALRAVECKNVTLLTKSGKDLDLVRGVYGESPNICVPLEIAEAQKSGKNQ